MMVVVTMVVNQGEMIRIVISYDGCGYNGMVVFTMVVNQGEIIRMVIS